jgi:hypothetical protein
VQAVAHDQALPARLHVTRGDRFAGHEQVVKAPRPGKTGFIGGVQHIARLLQQAPGVFLREKLEEALGADPHPAPEQALEMELAQAGGGRDLTQGGLAANVFFQKSDGLLDPAIILGQLLIVAHEPRVWRKGTADNPILAARTPFASAMA